MKQQSESCSLNVSRYGLVTTAAQRHLDEPGNHQQISYDLHQQLVDHYQLMHISKPDHAAQKVARGVRGAAFSAFFHIAATPSHETTSVKVSGEDATFRHTQLQTLPARQFAGRVSSSMINRWDLTTRRMDDPNDVLSAYSGLAAILADLNQEFVEATELTQPGFAFNEPLRDLFQSAAEDNATAQLAVLIAAGKASRQLQPAASSLAMAEFVIANVGVLGDRASVNRGTSAAMSIYNEPTAPGFYIGRQAIIAEYETALLDGRPMADTPDLLRAHPQLHWGSSLQNGPWREPGHCAAFPVLRSHIDASLQYRTIDTELKLAAHVASDTIFVQWPQ